MATMASKGGTADYSAASMENHGSIATENELLDADRKLAGTVQPAQNKQSCTTTTSNTSTAMNDALLAAQCAAPVPSLPDFVNEVISVQSANGGESSIVEVKLFLNESVQMLERLSVRPFDADVRKFRKVLRELAAPLVFVKNVHQVSGKVDGRLVRMDRNNAEFHSVLQVMFDLRSVQRPCMEVCIVSCAPETVLSSGSLPATPSRVDDNAIVTESTADVLDQSMGNPEHEDYGVILIQHTAGRTTTPDDDIQSLQAASGKKTGADDDVNSTGTSPTDGRDVASTGDLDDDATMSDDDSEQGGGGVKLPSFELVRG